MPTAYEHPAVVHSSEIRLLRLLPSIDWTAKLCGELFTTPLEQTLGYEAISYTWGGVEHGDFISIGDAELGIPQGCAMALRRLRGTHRVRLLWIDAICIKQTNVPERNSQVELMPHIYSQARSVQIYLGESDPASVWVFEQLRRSISIHKHKLRTAQDLRNPAKTYRGHLETS